MQCCTRYLEGKSFETVLGRHRIVSDQRTEDGGNDAGPTPPELLLAFLGSCAGHYAAEYLRARSLPITGPRVTVYADKGGRPVRMVHFVSRWRSLVWIWRSVNGRDCYER